MEEEGDAVAEEMDEAVEEKDDEAVEERVMWWQTIYPSPLGLIHLELEISPGKNNKTEAFAHSNIFIKSTIIAIELIPTLKNHI